MQENPFKSIPSLLVRNKIFSYLDSLDILACRYTCKYLREDSRELTSQLKDAADRSTKYWRWLYSIVECWCWRCDPMMSYMYWIVRVANRRTVTSFFNSYKYKMIIKYCPEVTARCILGACARGDVRIAKLVRGCTPRNHFRHDAVLHEACLYNHTELFIWLYDIGHIPEPDSPEAFKICQLIGKNGNLAMFKTIVSRQYDMTDDHWWLIAINALNNRHQHIMRYIYAHAPDTMYTRRFLLATITNDNPVAFRIYLERTGVWPTIEDSEYLSIYKSRRVAAVWDTLDFPMLPLVRIWFNSNTM